MLQRLSVIIISIVLTSPAWAEYIGNKQAWDRLSTSIQYGYVMGAYDEITTGYTDDSSSQVAYKQRVGNCIYDAKLRSNDLVELINTTYRKEVSMWRFPPNIILRIALEEYCR